MDVDVMSKLSGDQEFLSDRSERNIVAIALGKGTVMFEGIPKRLALRLTGSRNFGNGNVLL